MSANNWACENVSGPVWMAIVCKPLLTVEWGIDNGEKDCRWCVADTLSNYDNYYVMLRSKNDSLHIINPQNT